MHLNPSMVLLAAVSSAGVLCVACDTGRTTPSSPQVDGPGSTIDSTAAPPPAPPKSFARTWPDPLPIADLRTLYHLSEGSDLFPVSWAFALESNVTHRSFMDGLERFGLLPDPTSSERLPIGMTSGTPRDLNFTGIKMIGFNCSACHVGQLQYKGSTYTILGAPNVFDIKRFYTELFASAEETLGDLRKIYAFVRAVVAHGTEQAHTFTALPATELKNYSASLQTFDALPSQSDAGNDLADRLAEVHRQELARPTEDATMLFIAAENAADPKRSVASPISRWTSPVEIETLGGPKFRKSANPAAADSTDSSRAKAFISEFVVTIRLLKSRIAFLKNLASVGHDPVVAGPGRVDAFGTARNLMFSKNAEATDAPINYPLLWGFKDLSWLHWDGNTNSIMERNIGQAIGLGAIIDTTSGDSTVMAKNIHDLEVIASNFTAPRWDEDVLGAIDRTRLAAGRAIYDEVCKGCHESGNAFELPEIGTDPSRANSFARPLAGAEFAKKLRGVLLKAEEAAFDRETIAPADRAAWAGKSDWQTTRKYPARPLAGIWASAPFLHNGSVPTIWDLLSATRPPKFAIGHREYDPKKLGYQADYAGAPAQFDATIAGNLNSGHSDPKYGTMLSDEQKWSLIEYLKTL